LARVSPPPKQSALLGVVLVVAAASCFATMDTTVRYVGAFFSVAIVLWVRYALHAVAMTTWIALSPDKSFRTGNPLFQIARGALLAFSSAMAFAALRRMPVAEFTAIVMLTPLAATLLARVWLHEKVSRLRWVLVAGGFLGALIVIRPGSGMFGWAVAFPLAAAFSNAAFQVMSSKYAAHENAYTTNFYTGLTGTLVMTPFLIASGIDADGVLLAIGALGTAGHLLLVMALGLAPTATLMPFLYTQVGFAALVGWLVFRVLPDGWGWLGIGVIAACGAAGAWLNMRRPVSAVEADTVAD
jgi:drug/metabolite transporter (DMT)-like permease